MTEKQVTVKLFFNRSNSYYYVQIGWKLYKVSNKIAASIQEETELEVRQVDDEKSMQILSLSDNQKT